MDEKTAEPLLGEQDALDAVLIAGESVTNEIRKWATALTEGHVTVRALATVASAAIVVVGVLAFFGSVLKDPLNALMQGYLVVFGGVLFVLEARTYIFTHRWRILLSEHAKFLTTIWGRGLFYVFVGSVSLAMKNFFNSVVGLGTILVGVLMIVIGRVADNKLSELRQSLYDEDALKRKFMVSYSLC